MRHAFRFQFDPAYPDVELLPHKQEYLSPECIRYGRGETWVEAFYDMVERGEFIEFFRTRPHLMERRFIGVSWLGEEDG